MALEIPSTVTVAELGDHLGVSPINVIKTLMRNGIMATMNQALDFDTAAIVAADLNIEVVEAGRVNVPELPEYKPEIDESPVYDLASELTFDDATDEPEVALPEVVEVLEEERPRALRRPTKGRRGESAGRARLSDDDGRTTGPVISIEEQEVPEDAEDDLVKRPPVVAVMGHVDHGKTLLLDTIRSANVVASEAGGITQHIGAYQVERNGEKITFLDTPGHAAFTAMRARGASVTDIAIVVVAASEGVMPQTIEAINHARAAGIPIIVALNKMDLPDVNPDRVKGELAENGVALIEWGGDTELVPVSAKTGEGIDHLLETIILTAEVANDARGLRANPNAAPSGTIIEARMDRQRGPLATVIVQRGTLKVGQFIVAGGTAGKVRAMTNDVGIQIKEAGPSTPVTLLGMSDVPSAGDRFRVYGSEKEARDRAGERAVVIKQASLNRPARGAAAVTDLFAQMNDGRPKEVRLVIKADVQGSLEAIVHVLTDMAESPNGENAANLRILHSSVGPITESDALLASASDAIIVGFGVSPDPAARRVIKSEGVDARQYTVIYKLTEDIEALLVGEREPVYQEVVYGHAEVRQIFTSGRTTIAGGQVTDGRIVRNSTIRVLRGGELIWTGPVASLKRFKEDVREVQAGFEFGLVLDGFNGEQQDDILESFGQERVA
jgi:translation initiation factor IF-2